MNMNNQPNNELDSPITKREFREHINTLMTVAATKDDLKNFATKDDLKKFATKDELLKTFATKEDLKDLEHSVNLTISNKMNIVLTSTDKMIKRLDIHLTEQAAIKEAVAQSNTTIHSHEHRIHAIENRFTSIPSSS